MNDIKEKRLERILKLATFITSIVAIALSYAAYRQTTEQKLAGARPILRIYGTWGGDKHGLFISNPGPGVAILKAAEVVTPKLTINLMKGNPLPNFLTSLGYEPHCFVVGRFIFDHVLKSGEDSPFLLWHKPASENANSNSVTQSPACLAAMGFFATNEARIKVTYQSLYGEVFTEEKALNLNDPYFKEEFESPSKQLSEIRQELPKAMNELKEKMDAIEKEMNLINARKRIENQP